jgi:hypothetical protein
MDTWRGPLDGWQELLEVWGLFLAFAILVLGGVAVNAWARRHPSRSRWRAAVPLAAHRWARRLGACTAPARKTLLREIADMADRRKRAARKVLDEQRVPPQASGAAVNSTVEA